MPKKYHDTPQPEKEPQEKATPTPKGRLLGKLVLLKSVRQRMKEDKELHDGLREEVIGLIKNKEFSRGQGIYTFDDDRAGVHAQLQIQAKEYFNTVAAMDVLNTLDEDIANKYTVVSTTKDLMASALINEDITDEQLSTCFKTQEVPVITFKDES